MDEPPEGRPSRAYCLFLSESRPLGVPLDAVAEVMEAGRLVRLPLCPGQVVGLCTYRGKIVPVVRPGDEGGGPPGGGEGGGRAVLILRTGRGLWGLSIDRGGVSVEVAGEGPAGEGPPIGRGFVASGSVGRRGTSHAVLDPDRSWRGVKTEIDQWYADALGSGGDGFPPPPGQGGVGSGASDTRQGGQP
ncbi:chemotaxis protein CheW [Tautonia plasticadhaerens]|uniref:CheW-like domain protein n=1 Tax=Tautonia plasticadhaerens TaxID=2527974 RepID=A0A518H4P9_9BACT|nr:chemotaxis protein CheW [Tautonia plasticadhaerens]QDV35814.1 CheW-like domain protein [Tautonia plasticadhaerens]